MDDPNALLLPPSEPDASVSNGFANPIDILNYASPWAWINAAIEGLAGVDVFGWMTGWVSGDWSAIWKFGDAVSNLGDCLQQLAINIQKGVIDLDLSWDGNASDAAYQYFSNFAAALSGQQIPIYDIVDNYHKAAVGAWELSNQLANIMQAIADKAILAGIAAAAGTITAESGIGAVVGYGAAALIVVDILQLINKASTIINTAGTIIAGLAVREWTRHIEAAICRPCPSHLRPTACREPDMATSTPGHDSGDSDAIGRELEDMSGSPSLAHELQAPHSARCVAGLGSSSGS